ncbi:MAG: fumarylacetoacetate hydrolase family protein [Gammaproteobacteria bacterium]
MKLATLRQGGRDGNLIVVSKNLSHGVKVPDIAKSLIVALESWEYCEYNLQQVYHDLNHKKIKNSFNLDIEKLAPPLPRSFQRLMTYAYLPQLERSYSVHEQNFPDQLRQTPEIYQAASDNFLSCRESIALSNESWGCDMQAQIAAITDDVTMSTDAEEAQYHLRLLLVANNIVLNNISDHSQEHDLCNSEHNPCTGFSPIAVTPDELGEYWQNNKLHLRLITKLNQQTLGQLSTAIDMQFDFSQLISAASKTRALSAGTIICSGPIANADTSNGVSNIQDLRNIEFLQQGDSATHFLRFGDRVQIEALDEQGHSIFGTIDQSVIQW